MGAIYCERTITLSWGNSRRRSMVVRSPSSFIPGGIRTSVISTSIISPALSSALTRERSWPASCACPIISCPVRSRIPPKPSRIRAESSARKIFMPLPRFLPGLVIAVLMLLPWLVLLAESRSGDCRQKQLNVLASQKARALEVSQLHLALHPLWKYADRYLRRAG